MESEWTELQYRQCTSCILEECGQALAAVDQQQTERLLNAVTDAKRVFFIGVGRVLLSLEAIAKRWSHLGLDTHVVGEITEPAITPGDLLIVGSGSGESVIPVAIARKAASLGANIAYIGSNMESTAAKLSSIRVRIPVRTKLERPDEIASRQIMTSLFEQSLLLYGDALAAMISQKQETDLSALWRKHANLE